MYSSSPDNHSTMPELKVSHTSVPDALGNRGEPRDATNCSKDGKNPVSPHSPHRENNSSITAASTSRGVALKPPSHPISGCKLGNKIPLATTAYGVDIPAVSLQGHPIPFSCSAKGERPLPQSEENLARTLPTSEAPPPPSVLSGCSVATVHNSPVEQNRDTSTDNHVLNSEYDSQSKHEDMTTMKKAHMKSYPQTQTTTICNRLECFDIQNRVPRTDIPEVAVESSDDQGATRNQVSQQSRVSQGPQESSISQSLGSTFTGAELSDSSNNFSKTTTNFSTATSQEKGQVSVDISKCKISDIASSDISTDKSNNQISVSRKKSLQGKNDELVCSNDQKQRDEYKEMTFMSAYEKYVTEERGRSITTQLKPISSKNLIDYPAMLSNDRCIKAALLGQNMHHNQENHISLEREKPVDPQSTYVPANEMTTVPTATTLKEMVQRRLSTNPGKTSGIDDSSEKSTTISLLNSHGMKVGAVDTKASGGFVQALGLIRIPSLQNPSVHDQNMSVRDAFPYFNATVQSHMLRRGHWEKLAINSPGIHNPTQSPPPVTVLDMSTGVSAPDVQTDIKGRGRGRGRGSRTRGGGRRARGVRRINANTHSSTNPKDKGEDYGGMDSLDPLQIDDSCTQPKMRGGRGTRIRGGGRRNGRGRGSLSQETNPVVDLAGSKVNEGVAFAFSTGQVKGRGVTKPIRKRRPRRGGVSSERLDAYVDLAKGGLDCTEKHTPGRYESNTPLASRNDGSGNVTSYREVVRCTQDGSSSSVDADMHSTTKRLTPHSTIMSLINQPTLQPIPPCSLESEVVRTTSSILLDRERENNLNAQPDMSQYHLHQMRHMSPSFNHSPAQRTAQNLVVTHQSTTLPTLANVLTPDRSQYAVSKPTSAQLQMGSTPDLANVLANNRPTDSSQSPRSRIEQFHEMKARENKASMRDPHQTNVIDLTEDSGASATPSGRVMSQSRANVRDLQQPMRRQSCPDLHLSIPVPVCQMSKDTTSTKTSLKENENISLLQAPVLLPKDMTHSTTTNSPEIRQQQAQSSAAMQSPTVVSILKGPLRHLSPAHQVQPKETLRLTRMLTPPAAHSKYCNSDILIEPAPADISAIHVEMIHHRNEADSPNGSSRKTNQAKSASNSRYSTKSTSVSSGSRIEEVRLPVSDYGGLCPHGHKCLCTHSNASSPDVQIQKSPLPSTSTFDINSIQHQSHTQSKPVENDQMQASNLTVQREKSAHSKPASIPRPFGITPKEKCMTTCAHQFFGQSTHGMGFPHCAHTSACPKVTLQQKCCQHLTGVPPPAHSKIPIEIHQATPLDLTALPPEIIEDGLNLSVKENNISGPPPDKQQIGPHATEALKTHADGLCGTKTVSSVSTFSFQHVNYSKISQGIVNEDNSREISVDTVVPNLVIEPELSVNNTIIQTQKKTIQQQLKGSDEPQLYSSDHVERPTTDKQIGQQREIVTKTDQKQLENVLVEQKESENTSEEGSDLTTKIHPVYDVMEKSTIVQEKKQDRPKQKKSTKVNINTIGKNLVKLAEREQQLKVGKRATKKPDPETPEILSSFVTPADTTQQNSPADDTNNLMDPANSLKDIPTERITTMLNITDPVTESESGLNTLTENGLPARPKGSVNIQRNKGRTAVKAKKAVPNDSPIRKRRNNKKSASLHLDTNADIEPPQTSRPKRACVTDKKECDCPGCKMYDMPKRRRSKESASGNSTPSTPSTSLVQHVSPLMPTNSEMESSTYSSTDTFDGSTQVLSGMNFEVNKQLPAAHAVPNNMHLYENKEQPSKHSPQAVDKTQPSKAVAGFRELKDCKSLTIRLTDINKKTLTDICPSEAEIIPNLSPVVDTEMNSSICLTAVTHTGNTGSEPEVLIQEVDKAVPSLAEDEAVPSIAQDTVIYKGVDEVGLSEMHSEKAQDEVEGMAGPSVQNEDLSKETTEIQDMKIEIQQGASDVADGSTEYVTDGSTELGLVISSVVGGFTEGPTNDWEPTVKGELNEQHRAEISDSGHFSLSDNENILRLPVSETDSIETNLGCPEETSENILGIVTVKPDKTEEPEEVASQDSIQIKVEVNDQSTEESTGRSESYQNAVNSNSDTDSDLPSFYSYLSAGNPRSVNSKEIVYSDMQSERQMTLEECDEDIGTPTSGWRKKGVKGKGRKRHLTRRKKSRLKMVTPPIIYEDIDELPDIKHHIVIQDYSTAEKEAITGNEVIHLETGKEQVPDFPNIVIKQEPVDNTSIGFPLMKECSIVLQKIKLADLQLPKQNSKQSQSRKRKSSTLPKTSGQTKYRRTSKTATKVSLEIADDAMDSTEAGSLCAMQTTDQVIKSEPSYDEASTSAYSDGGDSALESEDDECNLKVLQNNVVNSNKPQDQAGSKNNVSENNTVFDQPKDKQTSSDPIPPANLSYLQVESETNTLIQNNQDSVSDVCDAENIKAPTVDEVDSNILPTEDAEPDTSTNMSYQQKCTSSQQDYMPDHQTRISEGQENRLDQTEDVTQQQDGTFGKEKDQLNNQKSIEEAVPGEEAGSTVFNMKTNECKSDEKEQPSGKIVNQSEFQSTEDIDNPPDSCGSKNSNIIQEGSVTESECSRQCQTPDLLAACHEHINLKTGCKQQTFANVLAPENEQFEELTNLSSQPQLQEQNSEPSQSSRCKLSSLPNVADHPKKRRTGRNASKEVPEITDSARDSTETGSLSVLKTTDQVIKSKPPCNKIVNHDSCSSMIATKNSSPVPDATVNKNQEGSVTESGCSTHENQTVVKVAKTAGKKRPAGKRKMLKSKELECESACESLIKIQDDTLQEKAVTESECLGHKQPTTDILVADHNVVNIMEKAGEQRQTSDQLNVELLTGLRSTESSHEGQTVTNILESEAVSVETVKIKVAPPKKGIKTPARKRSAGKRKMLKPTGVESESVCEKPIKNPDDAVNSIQEEAVTELECSQQEHTTTVLPAAGNDTVNPLEEAREQVQTLKQIKPASSEPHTGSRLTESTSTEQTITDDPESVCQQQQITIQSESSSQKLLPIGNLLDAASKGDKAENKKVVPAKKGTKAAAKRQSGGRKKMLTPKGLESESVCEKSIENQDDTVNRLQQEAITELECSQHEFSTTVLPAAGHDAATPLEETGDQIQTLNQAEPASSELHTGAGVSESTSEEQPVPNVFASGCEQQTKLTNPPKSPSQETHPIRNLLEDACKGIRSVKKKEVTANRGTKLAARKQSGVKQKMLMTKGLGSESVHEKPIKNPEDTKTTNQKKAVTKSVGSEHEHLPTYLPGALATKGTITVAKKGTRTVAKKLSGGKQLMIMLKGLDSKSVCKTPSKNLDDTKTKNQEAAVTESDCSGHEHLPAYLPGALATRGTTTIAKKGTRTVAKKWSGGKQNTIKAKELDSGRVCKTPIKNPDDTETKNQETAVTESECSGQKDLTTYLPGELATKGTISVTKRRGGKQKATTPKQLDSKRVCKTPIKNPDETQTKNQETAVIESERSGDEHLPTYLPGALATKGTKSVTKKRSGGKQKKIMPNKGLDSKSICKTPIKNPDEAKTKNQKTAVTESKCSGPTTDLPASDHDAVTPLEEAGDQVQTSNRVEPASSELHTGSSVTESTRQQQTVINVQESICEQQLKVTNPPIRKLLETGTKGFKTYKVTKKGAKRLVGEKHKMLTIGGLESGSVRDKLIKKLKFEDMSVESKNINNTEVVKTCFVSLKRLDDKIIQSLNNGSYNCKLLAPISCTDLAPPSSPDQKPEEQNKIENDGLNKDELDSTLISDQSIAKVTPNDHESILEMLQRQVLENQSIIVQDSDVISPVSDSASPSEDDSMMPPLSPKRRPTDKQSPLWSYLARYRKK